MSVLKEFWEVVRFDSWEDFGLEMLAASIGISGGIAINALILWKL